jgi:hypothetical protein
MCFNRIKLFIKQKFTSPKSVLDIVEYRCYYERLEHAGTYCIVFDNEISFLTVSNSRTLKLVFLPDRTMDNMVLSDFMLCRPLSTGYNKHTLSHLKGNVKDNANKVKTIYYILYGV